MTVVLVAGAAGGLGHRTALAAARLPGTTVRGLVRTLSPSDPGKQKVRSIALGVVWRPLGQWLRLDAGSLQPAAAADCCPRLQLLTSAPFCILLLQALEALKAAGVELAEGDLLQPGTLGPAVAGVDVVVSCVMGDEAAMVDGQANLLNAAKDAGVKKAGHGPAALWRSERSFASFG